MAGTAQVRDNRRRRHAEVRAACISAMEELVAERAFKDVTIDEVASRAGLSRSAFYFYFPSKHELLIAATEEVATELYAEADRWWHGEGDPRSLVREAIEGVIGVYARHATLLRVTTEVSTYDDEARDFWRELVGRFISATATHLRADQDAGRPRALDPEQTAEGLVWMVERCCYMYLPGGERSPQELVDSLALLWIAALYPGEAGA